MHLITTLILSALFSLVELNSENFFDLRHDDMKQDAEYLPDGPRHWTSKRFWTKVTNIQQAILSAGEAAGTPLPDLIALCEVENDYVMRCLSTKNEMEGRGYKYFMTQSPDLRGIDVALMYNPQTFKPINHRTIRVTTLANMRPTRDVLYVSGRMPNGETLHVIVLHAPSRYGGIKESTPFRLQVTKRVNECVDSIHAIDAKANIVIAGDFNAAADEESVRSTCRRQMKNLSPMAHGSNGALGTYKYRKKWETIDHILVSEKMRSRLRRCFIHDAPFLIENDKFGGVKPKRTYVGYNYQRGYSDHLPLVATFNL